MTDMEWAIFIGLSLALLVGVIVWMALKRPRPDDSDPPYRRKDYDPHAQRGLPREPAPMPADPTQRFFVTANVEGALITGNRNGRVPQLTVRQEGSKLVVKGGRGVTDLVNEVRRSGALDFFTRGQTPEIEVEEDPTLFKREEWSWTGSRLDQVPPSMRHLYDED